MKKSLGLLALAATVLCSCQQNCNSAASSSPVRNDSVAAVAVAYVNTDSVMNSYEYAKKVENMLADKAEKSRTDFNVRMRSFQQEATEFQRKVNNNGFLSMERAQAEGNRLAKVEQELQALEQKLSVELQQEQMKLSSELRDSLCNFLKEYCNGRFTLVLSNTMGDNVLYSAPEVDITAEVVDALNARYAASQK